jgi:imidazole glycerol phosphate synthase subunit HisF
MLCHLCSRTIESYDGGAKFDGAAKLGDGLVHAACYVDLRAAEVAAAAVAAASIVEPRHRDIRWSPAVALVAQTVMHGLFVAFGIAKSEAMRLVLSRIHHA